MIFKKNNKAFIIRPISDHKYEEVDDDEIKEYIDDLISKDAFDEKGNKCVVNSTECASFIVKRKENLLRDSFQELSEKAKESPELHKQLKDLIESDKIKLPLQELNENIKEMGLDIKDVLNEQIEVIVISRRILYEITEISSFDGIWLR